MKDRRGAVPRREPPVSHRAIYHMRQEILRLLDFTEEEGEESLEERAFRWQKSYRTMRPAAACALIERLSEEGREEAELFSVAVLESLGRRLRADDWGPIVSAGCRLASVRAAERLVEKVALPLVERHGAIATELRSRIDAGEASPFESKVAARLDAAS